MKKLLLAGCLTVMMMMFVATPGAQAITYLLTSDHMTGGAGTPPFGTVDLVQSGADVNITVTLYDSNKFVLTGNPPQFDFVFNANGVALADITGTGIAGSGITKGGTPGSFTLQEDGTGDWMFGVTVVGQGQGSRIVAMSFCEPRSWTRVLSS